jgi:hypothetical protein
MVITETDTRSDVMHVARLPLVMVIASVTGEARDVWLFITVACGHDGRRVEHDVGERAGLRSSDDLMIIANGCVAATVGSPNYGTGIK